MVIGSYSWDCMPLVIVGEILKYLNLSDRLRISCVCRHWRTGLWQPLLWRVVKFRLSDNANQRTALRLVANKFGKFVHEATFEFQSRSFEVVKELSELLDLLGSNVQKLILKPSSFQIEWLSSDSDLDLNKAIQIFVKNVENVLCRSRNFKHLSLGCISEVIEHSQPLIESLQRRGHSSRLEVLHIASIKEETDKPAEFNLSPQVFLSFSQLTTLSVDYDHVTDEMIRGFIRNNRTRLRRLIIHVHDYEADHPHVSDDAWRSLTSAGNVELTLNLVHSLYGVENLQELISPSMPLVHFRALFCEHLDASAITFLGQQVGRTLKSFLYVDGMKGIDKPNKYSLDVEDPFVMLAWKCPELVSFTLIGYEISAQNVIAIGRLRGQKLMRLDIPQCCIIPTDEAPSIDYVITEVSTSLGQCWNPLPNDSLNPAIISEEADCETFYLDLLLSDQD